MKTSLDPRHLKRQKIVQDLFAWEAQSQAKSQKIKDPGHDGKFQKIVSLLPQIDEIVKQSAPEWTIEKINRVDLAILRLAIFELCFELSEPPKVIIDEAVELAKEFGGDHSPSFINGALGKALLSKTRLLKIMANKLGVEEEKLGPQANLRSDLNATDLEIADFIALLEKDLNIPPMPNLGQFKTVGNILDYIEDHND